MTQLRPRVLAACAMALASAGCAATSSPAATAPSVRTTSSATTTATTTAPANASSGPTPPGAPTPAPATTTPSAAATVPAAVDCRKAKCIALTYDDGPSPLTPKLLKAFTDRHATATLFMLGNAAETYPQTVRQAHRAGFEIANHTYDHQPISDLSDDKVSWEVTRTNAVLERITGAKPALMRPPYAARTKRTDAVVGSAGLAPVVWNNSPEDWVAGHDTAAVVARLTLERSSRNAIILMHDIHPWTVDAAPAIIDGLHKQGYTLVTVTQLLGRTTPGVLYPRA